MVFFSFNAAFAKEILDLTSRVRIAPFVVTLHQELKHSTLSGCF
jgi:hypothetical protein